MKAQQIIERTKVEEHEKGCFSLVSNVDFMECEIYINDNGQHDCKVWINDESVVLSNDVIEELYEHLNNEADEIEKPSDYRIHSGPDMMDLANQSKLNRTA